MRHQRSQQPTPVTAVGNGYNEFAAEALPTCLENIQTNTGGTSISADLYVCQTVESVYQQLGVNAAMAGGNAWGSFEAKMQFVSGLAITTTSVVILVRASKVISTTTISTQPNFNGEWETGKDLFAQHGNAYISSISLGGEFLAAYSFTALDAASYQSLVASAEANFSGGISDLNSQTQFDANISSMKKIANTREAFSQVGIGFSKSSLPKREDLCNFVLTFSDVDLDGPMVVDFSTLSYSTLPNCPSGFDQVDTYRNAYVSNDWQSGYADNLLLAQSRLALVNAVQSIYSAFGLAAVDTNFATVTADLNEDIAAVETWLSSVSVDPTDPSIPTPIFIGIYKGYPIQNYYLNTSSPGAGGFLGNSFTDITIGDIFDQHVLLGFLVNGDQWVDGLSYWNTPSAIGSYPNFMHGQYNGRNGPFHALSPGEFVSKIVVWGYQYTYVASIQVTTNYNTWSVDPPNAWNQDGPTTWTTPADSALVGFQGRSDEYLNYLVPVYVCFQPATWIGATTTLNPATSAPTTSSGITAPIEAVDFPLGVEDLDIWTCLANWGTAAWAKIQAAFLQKGGWEGWAQVEIAIALQEKFKNANIIRENPVYNDAALRCDISLQLKGYDVQVVEIKCESIFQDGSRRNAFCKAYGADIQKVLQHSVQQPYEPAQMWVIGFTCSNEAMNDMLAYPFPVKIYYRHLGQSKLGNLYMWGYVVEQGG
jgi:hypothetical protein